MFIAIAILLFLVMFGLCAKLIARVEGYYSSVFAFGLGAALYYVAIPVELWLTGVDHFMFAGHTIVLSANACLTVLVMAILAMIGFTTGYALSGLPTTFRQATPTDRAFDRRGWKIVAVMFIASVTTVVMFYRSEFLMAGTYVGNYTVTYTRPTFALAMKLATLSLAIATAVCLLRGRKYLIPAGAMLSLIFAWGIYSSNKDPIVLGILAACVPLAQRRIRRPFAFVALTIIALIGAAAFSVGFSAYRGGRGVSVEILLDRGLFRRIDPAGPMISLSETVASSPQYYLGATYARAAVRWIPRRIWPDRPLDLSEEYARKRIANWAPGMGLGYSLLAEAYANFGVIGGLIQYMLIGLTWGIAWRGVRALANFDHVWFTAVYGTLGYFLLFTMHRGPVSFTAALQALAPIAFLAIVSRVGTKKPQVSALAAVS